MHRAADSANSIRASARSISFPDRPSVLLSIFYSISIYFPSYVALANRVFILGRTSRSGSPQSWVNSGSYLTPTSIVQQLKPLIYKDFVNTKITTYLENASPTFHPDADRTEPKGSCRRQDKTLLGFAKLFLGSTARNFSVVKVKIPLKPNY